MTRLAEMADRFEAPRAGLWSWSGPLPVYRQGWKIHINVASTQIMDAIQHAEPVLKRFPYKRPRSPEIARKLESGRVLGPAAGKLITVYPGGRDCAIEAVTLLADSLRGFHGPLPGRDRRHELGSGVSYRFGGVRTRAHGSFPVVRSPDGAYIPDRRDEFVTFPRWEPDLFLGSYGHADLEAAMIRQLREMLGADELTHELLQQNTCWIARVTYTRDGETVTGIAKWGVARLTGQAGVRRVLGEYETMIRLPAWTVPHIHAQVLAGDCAALIAEDLGDGADIAAVPRSIDEYTRIEDGLSMLRSALTRHGAYTSDLALANVRWRDGKLALVDAETRGAVSEADARAILSEAERQSAASLASSLLGVNELGRPGPFPWLSQAVELRKGDLSTRDEDTGALHAIEQDTRALAERVAAAGLRSLTLSCRELVRRGIHGLDEASLFRGLAGLTWTVLDGGSVGVGCDAARVLMAAPDLMRCDGGLFSGGAGIALTVALTGLEAGDRHLVCAGEQALCELGSRPVARDDLFSGLAGIVAALCGLIARDPGGQTRDALETASLRLAHALRMRSRHETDRTPPRGLAYGDEGLWLAGAQALAHLEGETRDELASALAASVAADSGEGGAVSDVMCRGRAGTALALIEVMAVLPSLVMPIPGPVDARVSGAGLCHGAAGLLLPASSSRHQPGAASWQGGFRQRIVCAIAGTARGSASDVGWIDDRTGCLGTAFMTGSAGIVSSLLRYLGSGRLGMPHLASNEIFCD
jgi:hypothetical protein